MEFLAGHGVALKAETRSLRLFIVFVSLAATLCVAVGFLGMAIRNRIMIQQEMLSRAREDFKNIVLTRNWNSSYGGVYVEKRPGMVSNPYLENPDITDKLGKTYTKKNPALMTRELSELLKQNQGYFFRIASLKPLNPANSPDPEESRALRSFEQGALERFWNQTIDGKSYFRYMAPLRTESSCLACHAKQGYRVGDVRGGISVSFDVGALNARLKTNLEFIVGLAVLTVLLFVGSLLALFRQLVAKLRVVREKLVFQATCDDLTGLWNRRSILERLAEEMARHSRAGEPLGCILLDLDHFKTVNDRFGHAVGDKVLKQVAVSLKRALRQYDIVGRFGGEEFLLILPNTDHQTLHEAAERVRGCLAEQVRVQENSLTASFGITTYRIGENAETLLARADRGMYLAKENGRNRVEAGE